VGEIIDLTLEPLLVIVRIETVCEFRQDHQIVMVWSTRFSAVVPYISPSVLSEPVINLLNRENEIVGYAVMNTSTTSLRLVRIAPVTSSEEIWWALRRACSDPTGRRHTGS
jgi:hypothetical protein